MNSSHICLRIDTPLEMVRSVDLTTLLVRGATAATQRVDQLQQLPQTAEGEFRITP